MGSLCGQVNMAWRMSRSTVTLFLFPPSKSRLDWNEGRPQKKMPNQEYQKQTGAMNCKLKYGQLSVTYPPPHHHHLAWVARVILLDTDTNKVIRLLWFRPIPQSMQCFKSCTHAVLLNTIPTPTTDMHLLHLLLHLSLTPVSHFQGCVIRWILLCCPELHRGKHFTLQ